MIDLHTHSCCSDGSEVPARVMELAAEAGCGAVALTDHDSVAGVQEAKRRAGELGIQFISGVELSCHLGRHQIHLLGYFIDHEDTALLGHLSGQRDQRNERNARLLVRLNEMGFGITMEDVMAQAGGHSIGRPHFAGALMAHGAVSSIQEAFDRYLGQGTPGYTERRGLEVGRGIDWIRSAGGVAVWAHPLTPRHMESSELGALVEQLAEMGLTGMESYYGRYSVEDRQMLAVLAAKHNLVATGGSDYHGDFKTGLAIGVGEGDLDVPNEVVDELDMRRANSSS